MHLSVGIYCDSCGGEGRDEITTLYVPSCTFVTLLLIAVNVLISIISNTTITTTNITPRLLVFVFVLFPSDEPHSSVAEMC